MVEKFKVFAEFCSNWIILFLMVLVAGISSYYSFVLPNSTPVFKDGSEKAMFFFENMGLLWKLIGINIAAFIAYATFGSGFIGLNHRHEFESRGISITVSIFGIIAIIFSTFFLVRALSWFALFIFIGIVCIAILKFFFDSDSRR